MVHKGFLQTWQVNHLSERVLQRILTIVDQGKIPSDNFEIFLTGLHPLLALSPPPPFGYTAPPSSAWPPVMPCHRALLQKRETKMQCGLLLMGTLLSIEYTESCGKWHLRAEDFILNAVGSLGGTGKK
jgi:hypothetical protein